jgi:hypothetical protein
MLNYLQIERIRLPKLFIFDQLALEAKFITTKVNLVTLGFKATESMKERTVHSNVRLKVPASRSKFVLRLEVTIINLAVPAVEIDVDLGMLSESNMV